MEDGAFAGLARTHQRLDFAHHREICRTIHALRQQPLASPSVAEVRRLLGDVAPEGSEEALRFTLHKRMELQMAQRMLRRELQRNESELIMFQDKCVVCFEGGIHPIKPQTQTGEPYLGMSFPPEAVYQALPADWDGYFERRGGHTAAAMTDAQKAMVTSYLSILLTVLHALEQVIGSMQLQDAAMLCVHLLGMTIRSKYIRFEKYLEILHCLPALK
ncbi:uncharacterized protein ACA1_122330 [Acanthamoeba castellanii str. Neff]|uniref:Uncharacterized protein n=1 Tax=Acanthamoeba castellanii (strain ATCC 30010 / Neff) TaxID=1257118 RepID=L8GEM1_ACACF|nr:uncharacterized protein ACA1_122330 [Acanthamoeba castellanii str. Neff]ELR11472.1 hypothetical protein ACA1_122330 [Acanthamoeba castellanii str. Neff]